MTVPTLAIPNPALIIEPLDAVMAAITTFISGKFGVDAIDSSLHGDDGQFIDSAIAFIREGNEEFAEGMAEVAHDLADEMGGVGVHLSFVLAMSMAAEAGVYSARGDTDQAWRRASFAGILFGVLAGAAINNGEALREVMVKLSEKGVDARHEKNRKLKAFAIGRYRAGTWASANYAAHQLQAEVMAEAKRLDMRLSESNAQRTIVEWLRAADKESTAS